MDNLDSVLAHLVDSRVHPELARMEVAVLGALAQRAKYPPLNSGVFGAAAAMALVLGIATSAFPVAPAKAELVSPLGAYLALAPSTLLETHK